MPLHFPPTRKKNRIDHKTGAKNQILSVLVLIAVCSSLLFACQTPQQPAATPTPEFTLEPTFTVTPAVIRYSGDGNVVFLSIEENGYAHLFVYDMQSLPLTRITEGDWNDTSPALSPDRKLLAFASDRSGFWDLYVMDLQTGEVRQITNSPEYDASPSWSPDGQWLVFETYSRDNLDIAVVSVTNPGQGLIPVTQDPSSDHSPVWAPDGRHVAFVSTRGGDSDIWLADLDVAGDERYHNLSNTPYASENHPVWNFDGSKLLWASISQTIGYSGLYIWDANEPTREARWAGDGSWGAWNETAEKIVAVVDGPNQQYFMSYDVNGGILQPLTPLQGRVRGLTWGFAGLPNPFPFSFAQASIYKPPALWAPAVTPDSTVPNHRWYVVPVEGIQAPYPQLHDLVDESFNALRTRVIQETGWDTLASLENAFIPLTTSLEPGMKEDWLYTGRAFSINTLMATAGWLVTLREDIGGQTYWRVYIRCAVQDGSLGEPIHNAPWNLSARYDLDPTTYEQGGAYAPVPSGYWVDITDLTAVYGWERLPALPNWRTYYAGTRFSEFVMPDGLDWYAAMRELYPEEALVTPTQFLPPSLTPTQTYTPTPTKGPTRTPRATGTPTLSPTPAPPTGTPLPPTATSTPPTVIP